MLLKRSINEKDGDQNLGSKLSWSQYICLNVVIVLFSVAQVVEYNVVPLYMYSYFEENGGDKNTDNETYVNNTVNASETNECGFNSSNSEDTVQTLTTQWLWYLDLTHYGCLFFNIVSTGALSDVIGRKPFILLTLFGSVLRYFIKAILFYTNGDIHYLFIPYAISGLTGTPSSFQIAVLALISDSTSGGKSRSVYLAIYDLMLGIGEGSALVGSGYLIQDVGYVIPPIISSAICLLCGLVVIFTVTETLKPTNERISVGDSSKNLLGFYHNKSYIREQFPLWMFKLTILTYLIYVFPQSGGLDSIYEMGSPFCWSAEDIGWFQSVSLMITLIIGVCMMKILQIPFNDEVIGVLCFLSACGYRILFFLAKSTWMLYLGKLKNIEIFILITSAR